MWDEDFRDSLRALHVMFKSLIGLGGFREPGERGCGT